ncbi:branched-chain amino acid ABC transporter ATP-binding protein/permease [Arenibaculum pallidiluteum]|uniref:branched-chain amino acid ABC transporter ATP-binding protein/permease n=1 Tax=Arenibaculum pallidiluteum TaxID=2812559 RepID=UPI001A95B173|nr:branched-chain amino acid ABC transporter ATP-binding protein/permease [Arenibaculum pallidiluteum]
MALLRSLAPALAFAAVYFAASLAVTNSYYQLMMTLVLVWAVMGLSWNMISGYTGLVSFGHAAFFGLGAYFTVLAHVFFGISPWIAIPLAGVVGAAAGLVVGIPTFRLRGHYFALSMLAYPLALLYVFEWLGFQEVSVPMERTSPVAYMQFQDHRVHTWLALAILVGVIAVTRMVERSRFGMALIAIKQNEAAAEAAGIDTLAWKLRAMMLSAAIAGAIGGFYAVVLLVVTPVAVFGMLASAQALTVAMFGGVGTVWGPVIGALILIPTSETLHAELGARLPGIQGVIYGLAIVAVVLLAPEGVYWKVRDKLRQRRSRGEAVRPADAQAATAAAADAAAPAAVAELPRRRVTHGRTLLDVRNLSKSFGGLKAVQNVSFSVIEGQILGIIGPNGAGKTTLFNLLNGFLKPDAGEVLLDGTDMVGRKPHDLCAAGMGRTFQVMRPFARMTVAENVIVGAYVKAKTEDEARALAAQAIARVGLEAHVDRVAGGLTTKELRLMELARALAGQPRLLLLDETLAGLGRGEVGDVIAVVRRLAAEGTTIVIIEHTMHAMVRLVDSFVVLDHGKVLLDGAPEEVTRDPLVIEAYLGSKWSNAHA